MDHGLYIWMFILIGNAVALVALSSLTSGGTSAMGHGGARVVPSNSLPPRF